VPLHYYYFWRSLRSEGEAAFALAAEKLPQAAMGQSPPAAPETPTAGDCGNQRQQSRVLALLLALQIAFSIWLGHRELSERLAHKSAEILDGDELAGHDTRRERGWLLVQKGVIAQLTGEFEEFRRLAREALALFQELGDPWQTSDLLRFAGQAAQYSGDYGEARELMEQALVIRRRLGAAGSVYESLNFLSDLALTQGELERSESLIREALAIVQEIGDPVGAHHALTQMARNRLWLGEFRSAEALYLRLVEDSRARGVGESSVPMVSSAASLSQTRVHLGLWKQARDSGQAALSWARDIGNILPIAWSLQVLGEVALAEGAYGQAKQWLQEGSASCAEWAVPRRRSVIIAELATAERALGRRIAARQHLAEALRLGTRIGAARDAPPTTMCVLPVTALLLADRGEHERAVELYALAASHPYVANSRWFEQVYGRHIAAIAARLPPEVAEAARERGRAGDLEATAAELLAELDLEGDLPGAPPHRRV
jgi:tetratricopeptide (TPR) repeat protein